MKKLLFALAVVALIGSASKSLAAWGLFSADRSWIGIRINNSTNFYNVWNAGTGPFNGTALGVFSNTSTLQINAYDVKTFKNSGDNVTGGTFFWTVYTNGSRPVGPSFSSIGLNFIENIGTGGDQKWGFSGNTTSLLGAPAVQFPVLANTTNTYAFEFYVEVTGSPGGPVYDNNAGNNYVATFQTIPEPSTYALLALSAAAIGGYAIRRRVRSGGSSE